MEAPSPDHHPQTTFIRPGVLHKNAPYIPPPAARPRHWLCQTFIGTGSRTCNERAIATGCRGWPVCETHLWEDCHA